MSDRYADIAFTKGVAAQQERHGSRALYARLQAVGGPKDALGRREAEFLAQADSFFLATVGQTGWPYVQHRGGPAGFVRVLSPTRIAFPDFRGNRQYVSVGNAAGDDRASLIFVDYVQRLRLKLFGHLRFVEASSVDATLAPYTRLPGYEAKIERIAQVDVVALDWNCPRHIPQRSCAA